jgi:Tol biopolymer transport system component
VAPAARGSRGALWAALIALPIAGAALAWLVLGQSRARGEFAVEASTIVPASERPITSAIAPDGAWVAYIGLAGGRPDLYVRFLNGNAPANLTAGMNMPVQNRTIVGGLDVIAAGRGIALAGRPVREGLFRVPGIWVVPAPAGGPAERVTDRYAAARWSPDGRRIAGVIADPLAGDAVATADRDGRSERVLVAASGGIHVHQLAWGHDGRHVYYQRSLDPRGWAADIYRVPVDGGTPEPVVVGEGTAAFPAPTPDGRALVYAADRTGEGSNIWYRPFDGSPSRRLTAGAGEYAEPFLTGDGTALVCLARRRRGELVRFPVDGLDRSAATIGEAGSGDSDPSMVASSPRIVISSRRTGRRKIWSVDETGRQPQPLTTGDGTDYRPVASPDGRSVAFLSNRDGRRGLWVAPADGGPARLVVHAEVVDYVSWAPDSRRLVYAAAADVGTQLWTAGQDGTPPARVPQGVGRTPAWSPAGDVIAVVQADGDRPVVRFVSSSGNEVREALRLDGVGVPTAVAWSPDGARLAFVNLPGRGAAAVWVGRPSDGELRKVAEVPAPGEFEGVTWAPDGRSLVVGRIEHENEVVLIQGLPARR